MNRPRIVVAAAALLVCAALAAAADKPAGQKKNLGFDLYDRDNRMVHLSGVLADPAVRLAVVDFFGLACEPCKKALPKWEKLLADYRDKGLAVVIVVVPMGDDAGQEMADARTFFAKRNDPLTVVFDKYLVAAKKFGVVDAEKKTMEIPRAFVLDKQGDLLFSSGDEQAVAKDVADRLAPSAQTPPETKPTK